MLTKIYYPHILQPGSDSGRTPRSADEFAGCAWKFSVTYRQFDPGSEHELVVVFVRGNPSEGDYAIWSGVKCRFLHHSVPIEDRSWMVQNLLAKESCDFMVGFVSRAYFHRPGWLKRVVDARKQYGDAFYGSMASSAGCPLQTHPAPNPHLRGTMWAFDLQTISKFPHQIKTPEDEYRLECGEWNLSNWFESIGKPPRLVTFDGVWAKPDWDKPENAFCKGDQSNLLHWDRHTDAYRNSRPLEGDGRAR